MYKLQEIGEKYGITKAGARERQSKAFKNLVKKVKYHPNFRDFLVKPDIEKAFIKKYFEYHDVFADAKPTELGEVAKAELQSILDGKELETDNVKIERNPDKERKRKLELKDLNLSPRSYNALNKSYRHNIKTVGDITDLGEKDFREIRNLGQKSAAEVIEKIHSLGLKMKWEEDIEYEKVPEVKENILMSDEKSKTGILTIELDLSQRSYNCLARYGFDNVDDIINLEEKRFREIRNLGQKSADEIIEKIHSLGLKMKWERDAEEKAATDAQLEDSIQQLKTAYSDLKAKDEEYEELKQQLKDSRESKRSAEINPNTEKQESESKEQKNDDPSYGEL